MSKIQDEVKKEILERELKKYIEIKTMLQIELNLQEGQDPEELSARVNLKNGAYKEIKRKEYIEIKEKSLEDVNLKIKVVEDLLNN